MQGVLVSTEDNSRKGTFADTSTQEEDRKGSKHGLLNSEGDFAVITIPYFLLLGRDRK